MKKIVLGVAAAAFLAGCTTDPYTGQQKVSNTAGGAALGALAGGCVAHFTSRHGVELAHLLRWVPALAALGALEGAAVGAIGVRREPIVRWGKDRDATCLVAVLVAACMSATTALGVLVDAPLLVGPVAGFLLGLPVALRAFGLR